MPDLPPPTSDAATGHPEIALSTCWHSHRHQDGYLLLKEAADLGFSTVELSHGIRISLVPGILKALQENIVRVCSIHNFCPLPPGVFNAAPNLYQPTGQDKREREFWVRQTRKTIEFAVRVEARCVVLHGGSVRHFWSNPATRLKKAREQMRKQLPQAPDAQGLEVLSQNLLRKLTAKATLFRANLLASLREIVPFARERGIRLALENREDLNEMPFDQDFPSFLTEMAAPDVLGYWHDTGHAQIKQGLHLVRQETLLEANKSHHLGWHLHDVNAEDRDHQIPGTGVVAWSSLRPFYRPDHLLILELSPRMNPQEVLQGRAFLRDWLAAGADR